MKIYLAGNAGIAERDRRWIRLMTAKLTSFFQYYKTYEEPYPFKLIKRKMENEGKKVNLFLDSGAFSAYTQKVEIDVQEYIDFIKTHQDVIEVYANLDFIHLTDKKLSAVKTWENQMAMEAAGLKPIPVFHYGEDEKWLQRYLKKGYEYIALGGMVKTTNLLVWLDRIWHQYLVDEKGFPKVKVHGFGQTSLRLMLRYPWYSVDSTSWVVTGRLGSIFVPRYRDGKWIYDEDSWKISVSNKSPNKKEAGQHIDTLPPTQKAIFLDYIHAKGYQLGKSRFELRSQDYEPQENEKWAEKKPKEKSSKRLLEIIEEVGISNSYQLRDEMNIIYFVDLERNMPKWPWAFVNQSQTTML